MFARSSGSERPCSCRRLIPSREGRQLEKGQGYGKVEGKIKFINLFPARILSAILGRSGALVVPSQSRSDSLPPRPANLIRRRRPPGRPFRSWPLHPEPRASRAAGALAHCLRRSVTRPTPGAARVRDAVRRPCLPARDAPALGSRVSLETSPRHPVVAGGSNASSPGPFARRRLWRGSK